jgi:hypothetical protein
MKGCSFQSFDQSSAKAKAQSKLIVRRKERRDLEKVTLTSLIPVIKWFVSMLMLQSNFSTLSTLVVGGSSGASSQVNLETQFM